MSGLEAEPGGAGPRLRAWIYDQAIRPLTEHWYAAVLARLPPGARVLDVGIGTASALCAHAATVEALDLHIDGIDIDAHYLRAARRAVAAASLGQRVSLAQQDAHALEEGTWEAVYFSGSFMLIPEPARLLRSLTPRLVPGGAFFFTQTFEARPNPFLERAKPLLRALTSIDFGEVTYADDFDAVLAAGGLQIRHREPIGRQRRRRGAYLIEATPT